MDWEGFGPPLSREQLRKREALITRVGLVMIAAIFGFVVFGAAGGLHLFLD